ncbi:tetratricopeptide repeat protein [Pseudidiomarina sp. E22-M8]|uniref:tetratricopeptide repeat protein n=1 Tax=Pseudidiomarina sp. E22-M8 TaxID=3424768 RepID=UPI00403D2E27
MSVINRMLRDLDKRQQQERKNGFTPAAAAPSGFPWAWLLGAFVVAAIAVVAFMVIYQGMSKSEPELREQSTPTRIKVTQPETVTTPDGGETAAETVSAKPTAQASQPQRRLDPRPVTATPDSATTSEAVATPEPTATSEPTSAPRPTVTPGPTTEAGPQVSKVTDTTAASEPQQQAQEQTQQPNPQPAKTSGTMEVTRVELSAEELAEVKLKQAREAAQKGERERAGSLLEQVIALAPEHVNARSELAAYWYGRGRVTAALAVLEEGLQRRPQEPNWLVLYGKILLENGAYEQLMRALAQLPEDTAETSDLLQMRATAASELRRFAHAAVDYERLAERTQQGRWWIAAAVAHEDAEQPQQALRSYQQALQDDDLSQDARRYAAQRQQALGGQ